MRVRGERGQVALEALLSMLMLGCAFVVFWGIAVAIFNQSKVQTATQLAAQSALLTYDRSAYRGLSVTYQEAIDRAEQVAVNVYAENACGSLPDQFSDAPTQCYNTAPTMDDLTGEFSLQITCSESLSGGWSANKCYSGGAPSAQAVRAHTSTSAEQSLLLLAPLQGMGADEDRFGLPLRGNGRAYSYYPQPE